MKNLDRRSFLGLGAATAASLALPSQLHAAPVAPAASAGNVKFVFFTDTHIEPELNGGEGVAKAFARIKSLKPEFCIQGGDHCIDLTQQPRERSMMLLDLYAKTEHILDVPVHQVIGNHDVLGTESKGAIPTSDPLWGKKVFNDKWGKTYTSWDHKGYHFITLDSIYIDPKTGVYTPTVDAEQLTWLAADLAATKAGTPIIVTIHVPMVSAVPQYNKETYPYFKLTNAYDVLPLFEGHNILAVLQGHTHINEVVYWHDIPFITSGAVCGNWWKGSRWGTPEGFTVVELAGGKIHWRYETYGFKTVAPEKDPYSVVAQPKIPGSWPVR